MTKQSQAIQEIATIIQNNPNCEIRIDNDYWDIIDITAFDKDGDEIEGREPILADSNRYNFNSNWYGNSNNYGAGVADALVELLNRNGFNIKAEAV